MGLWRHFSTVIELGVIISPPLDMPKAIFFGVVMYPGPRSALVSQVGLLWRHLPTPQHPRINLVPPLSDASGPGPGRPTHLKLFFISRSFVMMATGSVSPVAFWISGSWPMVSTTETRVAAKVALPAAS